MGVVYRADDLVLGETVALKFLPDDVARDPQRLARLRNEVRLARQVSHPNICRVYDVAESDGRHFLTMEHLAGEDLEARLRARGRPPSDEALAIARQLCAGLAAAHERGVLHRDLKPANILLDERGVARIADFGLAEAGARVAGPRAREGTPEYMAPEALAGGEVTARSDIYALGLVLRDLFIGRQRPAAGAPGEAMAGSGMPPSGAGPAVPVPDPAVERLIARCLEPEPERRPASARAVLAALPGGAPFAAALAAAQQRADRIAAFRAELAELLRAGALALDAPRLAALRRYHEGVLADLVRDFDVDVDERGRHLSIGMMVVALVGALAVGASLLFLGYRVWGFMAFPMQAGILAVLPAAGLAATAIVGARDRTGYFTAIAAAFAFAGLVIDTTVLSGTLGLAGSPMALLAWAVFALILAFGYGTRLLLFTGVVCLAFFTATAIPHFMGAYWGEGMERWEGMIPAGVLALAASGPLGRRFRPEFAPLLRVLGLALVFAPALLLANDMQPSSLPFPGGAVAVGYQVAALLIGTGAVGAGIAGRARDLVYMGGACLVVLLYSKMVHWFWEWMPRYVFFLIVAAAAIGVLLLLRRLRGVLSAPPAEARP